MLSQTFGPSWQDQHGGPVYVVIGGVLFLIDPETLMVTEVSDAPQFATADMLVLNGTDIIIGASATLIRLARA